jgi:hypothetical protein
VQSATARLQFDQRRFERGVRLRGENVMSVEELDEIEALAASRGGAPRRETLVAAGEILRDRHLARKRGEEVPPLAPAAAD